MDSTFKGPIKFKDIPDSDALSTKQGIYIIKTPHRLSHAPLDIELIKKWIDRVESFEFDGLTTEHKPLTEDVKDFLECFWVPDRKILYIGRALGSNTIRRRLRAFYKHKLGDKKPHRGGHWLKTLSNYDDFDVYWYECCNPKNIENRCLDRFIESNSKRLIPFANLEDALKRRKQNKLRKTTREKHKLVK